MSNLKLNQEQKELVKLALELQFYLAVRPEAKSREKRLDKIMKQLGFTETDAPYYSL